MNTIRKFHWFWPWNDEKEENWLRQMSGQGWHFKSVDSLGFYLFEHGDPANFVYRLDFFTGRGDEANYQQLFEDAGWDYLGAMRGWQYFRQEAAQGNLQEIYTDNASKVQKYQRIRMLLLILVPIILGWVFLYVSPLNFNYQSTGQLPEMTMAFLMVVIFVFFTYAQVRLWQRISQLRANT